MISQVKCMIGGILCIHLFTLNITISHSSSNFTKLKENEEQINHCENWQFQCQNGKCIARPFICDGLKDCKDGSDETYGQCQNKSVTYCDKLHFQCKYGACIKKKYQCDGIKQCIDESDESPDMCNVLEDRPNRITLKRNADESCPVPVSSTDKTVYYDCNGKPSKTCQPSNGYVPKLTVATVICAADYYREDNNRSSVHFCYNKQWSPALTKCLKKCDRLNPVNVILECFRDGVSIDNCDQNLVLLAGTKVRPSCKPTHKYDSPPSYFQITCNEDGKWDNNLLPCVPECGKPYAQAQTLISGGEPDPIGGSPWHVAIFNKQKILICGGTIISEYIVLSAAHCFSEDSCNGTKCVLNSCEGIHCVDDFEVVVGKYTNNYTAVDNTYQRTMKIREIRFPKVGYLGLISRHSADLAFLILRDPIPISPAILPACINWEDLKNDKQPLEGELGKVAGWGRTENGTLSTILKSINLPFISYKRCFEIVDKDFQSFVTIDKFCAGSENRTGATLLDGDSGGGLLFEDRGLFYLRGVVSVKQYSSNSVTLFTDLNKHVNWIISMYNNVEPNSHLNQIQPNIIERDKILLVVHNTNIATQSSVHSVNPVGNINEEEVKRQLIAETVNHLKSYEYYAAEQKLSHMEPSTYYNVVHEVYNNQANGFDLLLNFGDSIKDEGRKLTIYLALSNEIKGSRLNDPRKLLQLMKSVKKGFDQSTEVGGVTIFQEYLKNEIIKEGIEPISSAFLNDNSWSTIKQLASDITNECRECALEIYKLLVKKVWNQITIDDFLSRTKNLKHLEEIMTIHAVVAAELESNGTLNTSSGKILLQYMNQIMESPGYLNVSEGLRSEYEEVKNEVDKHQLAGPTH